MHVHVTYTGGTIGMVDSPHGLVPGADLEGWLAQLLDDGAAGADDGISPGPEHPAETSRTNAPRPRRTDLETADSTTPLSSTDSTDSTGSPLTVTLSSLDPLIDSSNATPESWQAIIDDLRRRPEAQAFVVLHGTDTMAYTSAALAYALSDLGRPVVLTGSQLPLGALGSDAAANVTGALHAATSGRAPGVTLFFGQHLLAGARTTKTSSWAFEGFGSPTAPPLARTGAPWRWFSPPPAGEGWPGAAPYRRHDVVVVDLVPGITAARLKAMLTPRPDAVILRAFGVGNVPDAEPGLTEVLTGLIDAGVPVVVSSQCHEAAVELGRYQVGDALARAGAVGSVDMTLEATYAKVQFLLSQGADVAQWLGRNLAGELS